MGKFTVGDIVLVTFPFSNLKGQKIRPALILAHAEFHNFILCQITSKPYSSTTAIKIEQSDFKTGKLPVISFVRPDKVFTADQSIISRKAGALIVGKRNHILHAVSQLFMPE